MVRQQLTNADKQRLINFWTFYADEMLDVIRETNAMASTMPSLVPVLATRSGVDPDGTARRAHEVLRAAVVEGAWEPFYANLRVEGAAYANAGIPLAAWAELTRQTQRVTVQRLHTALGGDLHQLLRALEGLTIYENLVLEGIAAAWLSAPPRE